MPVFPAPAKRAFRRPEFRAFLSKMAGVDLSGHTHAQLLDYLARFPAPALWAWAGLAFSRVLQCPGIRQVFPTWQDFPATPTAPPHGFELGLLSQGAEPGRVVYYRDCVCPPHCPHGTQVAFEHAVDAGQAVSGFPEKVLGQAYASPRQVEQALAGNMEPFFAALRQWTLEANLARAQPKPAGRPARL